MAAALAGPGGNEFAARAQQAPEPTPDAPFTATIPPDNRPLAPALADAGDQGSTAWDQRDGAADAPADASPAEGSDAAVRSSAQDADAGRDTSAALASQGISAQRPAGEGVDEARARPGDGLRLSEDDLVPEYDQDTTAALARRVRRQAENAYAPVGIRTGGFILRPSLDVRGGHTRGDGEESEDFLRLEPELVLDSDWSRHALSVRGAVRHDEGDGDPSSRTDIDAGIDLRLDIDRDTTVGLELGFTRDQVSPTDPDLPETALDETQVDELSFAARVSRAFRPRCGDAERGHLRLCLRRNAGERRRAGGGQFRAGLPRL